jgi:hypothetical protein
MTQRLIEALSGHGRIFHDDTFLANAQYHIRRYEEYDNASHQRDLGTPMSVRESIDLTLDSSDLQPSQRPYTLLLADGRAIEFYVMGGGNVRSSGAIRALSTPLVKR